MPPAFCIGIREGQDTDVGLSERKCCPRVAGTIDDRDGDFRSPGRITNRNHLIEIESAILRFEVMREFSRLKNVIVDYSGEMQDPFVIRLK